MSNPNQAPFVEAAEPGVFERLETAFRNSHVGQLATLAVASFGIASAAEAYTAEPVGAENVPVATSQQECVNDALAPMRVTDARLKRPHNNNGATQVALANANTIQMPSNCLSEFGIYRDVRFEFDVQDGLQRKYWNPFLYDTLDDSSGNAAYTSGLPSMLLRLPYPHQWEFYPPTKSQLEIGVYECTPGPKTTGVKLRTEEIAINAQTNPAAVVASRKFPVVPVKKILPKPC